MLSLFIVAVPATVTPEPAANVNVCPVVLLMPSRKDDPTCVSDALYAVTIFAAVSVVSVMAPVAAPVLKIQPPTIFAADNVTPVALLTVATDEFRETSVPMADAISAAVTDPV